MRPLKNSSITVKLIGCLVIIFAINIITELTEFYEAKYIAVIFFGFFAHQEWGHEEDDMPEEKLKSVWSVCCPFLFGSIGAAVDLSLIEPNTIFVSFVVVMLGEVARWCMVIIVTMGKGFTFKE